MKFRQERNPLTASQGSAQRRNWDELLGQQDEKNTFVISFRALLSWHRTAERTVGFPLFPSAIQMKNHRQEMAMDVVPASCSCDDHFAWSQLRFPPVPFVLVRAQKTLTLLPRSQAVAEVNPSWNKQSHNTKCVPKEKKSSTPAPRPSKLFSGTLGMSLRGECDKGRLGVCQKGFEKVWGFFCCGVFFF